MNALLLCFRRRQACLLAEWGLKERFEFLVLHVDEFRPILEPFLSGLGLLNAGRPLSSDDEMEKVGSFVKRAAQSSMLSPS